MGIGIKKCGLPNIAWGSVYNRSYYENKTTIYVKTHHTHQPGIPGKTVPIMDNRFHDITIIIKYAYWKQFCICVKTFFRISKTHQHTGSVINRSSQSKSFPLHISKPPNTRDRFKTDPYDTIEYPILQDYFLNISGSGSNHPHPGQYGHNTIFANGN